MFIDFFKKECNHDKVRDDIEEMYCPDCGMLIQNKWFLVRCKCCNIKRTARRYYENIIPDTKFCKNCGSNKYYIEELDKPNFTDIRYAVFKKIIVNTQKKLIKNVYSQIWIEKPEISQDIKVVKIV